jgi:hypothetical protein
MWHAWERKVYSVWWESLKERDQLGRSRCRWEDGIRIDLRETGWSGFCRLSMGAGGGLL